MKESWSEWISKRHYLVRFFYHLSINYFFVAVVLSIKILMLWLLGFETSVKLFASVGFPCAYVFAIFYTMNQEI